MAYGSVRLAEHLGWLVTHDQERTAFLAMLGTWFYLEVLSELRRIRIAVERAPGAGQLDA